VKGFLTLCEINDQVGVYLIKTTGWEGKLMTQ